MRFTIDIEEIQYLLKCLRASIKATSTDLDGRVSILAREDNSVSFSTDIGTIGTSYTAESTQVKEAGSVGVVYADLQNFVNSFKPWSEGHGGVKEVNFRLNEKSLSLNLDNLHSETKKSKSNIKLKIYSSSEQKHDKFGDVTFVLSSSMLKSAIDKTIYAIDPLSSHIFLRGLNLMFDSDNIYFAGTNGVVLSEYSVKNTTTGPEKNIIITHEFVKGLRSVLANVSKEEAQVEFSVSEKVIKARTSGVTFWGQLIAGYKFPNYRIEFTKPYKHKLVFDRELLLSNLNPVLGALDDDDNNRMTILMEGNTVKFYSDLSDSEFELENEIDGKFIIDVNGKLCRDVINSVKDDRLIMYCNNENDNIVFDSEMFEDQKSLLTFIRRRS